ncbi:hypothetical protein H6784_06080 [Candidatus Nomurabacteria bacterium]|nr:hypothetical protein [Candidatus Kaiserbacteria bacterium]MCB9811080.1 hypothetical protein [Candidatus Nomurabacteria bacterium]MCB9814940.1 hypothetical protein [Candidatus Nomurabacteria bacterium]
MVDKQKVDTGFVMDFAQLSKKDVEIAGGKGASLGEMTQAGISVPPGYVVLTAAFEQFLDETDLRQVIRAELAKVDQNAVHTADHASEQIQNLIKKEEVPENIKIAILASFKELNTTYVAVRSSATSEDCADNAWAGQLDSFLNTTEDTLLENVKNCWASLFTPRAIFYRIEKGLQESHVSVAVVVQKMVESESSGIAFSVHPVTEDYNQLIIEAGFGLGEAIVSGSITPDSYVIEKEPRKIIDINIAEQKKGIYRKLNQGGNEWRDISAVEGSKQVLTDEQILELSELILKIENHYSFPCDIEWAFEKGVFYIVQSRPITTLQQHAEVENLVDQLKNIEWVSDWSVASPVIDICTAPGTYYNGLHELFGVSISNVLITYRDGVASAKLSLPEYNYLGKVLAEKVQNIDFVRKWADNFKVSADKVMSRIQVTPEKLLEEMPPMNIYWKYGAYNVATKTVFNFLPDDFSEESKKLLEEARKYSETFYVDNSRVLSEMFKIIASKSGYATELVFMMTRDEIEHFRDNQILPDKNVLINRRKRSGMYLHDGKMQFLSGEEVDEVEMNLIHEFNGRELYGQTAYRGIVSGRCRIVQDFSNADIQEGEVLVTGMTNPNSVPLMKKVSAIVTDGGGVLSHAAIVSRELKKPCIIGTKIATHVLQDGDLVEVDADNGVVRVLDRVT